MPKLSDTFTVGAFEVAALSDGAPDRALEQFFVGAQPGEWTAALGITDPKQPMPFNFGTFLVRGRGQTLLIDSGYGPPARSMGIPGGGELLDRMADLGVTPEEVQTIVHTHLHPDHCGWDVGEDRRTLTFPNAVIFVSRVELDYWLHETAEGDPRSAQAREAITPPKEQGRVATFDGEVDVIPGVTTVPTPGHTPGHTSVLISSQNEHLLVVGDAAHHPVHLEHHDWIPQVDLNPAESKRSRARLAALAVEKDAVVTGGHFPILTRGKLRRVETGYRWEAL
jgi:glyoxylase-like metal-dependent hydrolase (beta-lactamase superfamily II)